MLIIISEMTGRVLSLKQIRKKMTTIILSLMVSLNFSRLCSINLLAHLTNANTTTRATNNTTGVISNSTTYRLSNLFNGAKISWRFVHLSNQLTARVYDSAGIFLYNSSPSNNGNNR